MSDDYKKFENKYKVSVIVPVFNSKKYLYPCMESIVSQTLEDIQIICVDDGSTDGSLDTLNEYRRKYSNFFVMQTKHSGAAEARNKGMLEAQGEYVIFLDSDDVFENDMLEALYNCAKTFDADVSVCEFDSEFCKHSDRYLESALEKYMKQYSIKPFKVSELPICGLLFWSTAPWNKMCKKDFLIENNIYFQDLKSANDIYFSNKLLLLADKIIHTKSFKSMIHYREDIEEQISKKRSFEDVYVAFEKVYRDILKNGMIESVYAHYCIEAFNHIVSIILKSDDEKGGKYYNFFSDSGMKVIGLEQKHGNFGAYEEFFECFKDLPYESKWFQNSKMVELQLKQKGLNEIRSMCQINRVAVWGAGMRGRAILKLFYENEIYLEGVIDNDKVKQGNIICGYVIQPYLEISERTDVVIVANKGNFSSVCREIKLSKKKIKIIPLFAYFESELKLEDCIFELDDIL